MNDSTIIIPRYTPFGCIKKLPKPVDSFNSESFFFFLYTTPQVQNWDDTSQHS
jgi:hypothetical protein